MNFGQAQLVILEPMRNIRTCAINTDQVIIGRSGGANDIGLSAQFVSSQQCIIANYNGKYLFSDLASLNGTYLNDKLYKTVNESTPFVEIKDGDVLCIGNPSSREKVFILFSTTTNDYDYSWRLQNLEENAKITIGRDQSSVICVPNITVSRSHAEIVKKGGVITVRDNNSVNGTIVNNQIVNGTVKLDNFSVIRIGNTKIVRIDEAVAYSVPKVSKTDGYSQYMRYSEDDRNKNRNREKQNIPQPVRSEPQEYDIARQGGAEVRVENVSRVVPCKKGTGENGSDKKHILENISLTIHQGELVAILGGSGAGKTTFMNCINGFEPATEGKVYINSSDLYKNYQALKFNIGYVPQQDIVHGDLTVQDMLSYIGQLRLPKDVSKNEIGQRVAEVLDMVDLTQQKDTYIKKLSGGQRKRASIAVELVSDPALLFLDEPTSGLDPEAETHLMHELKDLSSKKGKTVIVITHTLQNINLFDKVIFLAPGGKLCFYGTPQEARGFFEVDNLADAYKKISSNVDGYVKKYNDLRGKEVSRR